MTLTEAKNKWGASYEKICLWLEKGYIPDVQFENGKISINGCKPHVPKNGSNITIENVRKYILRACMKFEYIDYRILLIQKEQFSAILLQLEEGGYLQKNLPEADDTSNRYYTITEKGEDFLQKKKLQLDNLNFTLKFKYLEVNAEIRKEK